MRRSDAACEQQSCAGEPDEYHDESPSSGHNGRASAPPLDAAAEQRFPGFFPQRCRASYLYELRKSRIRTKAASHTIQALAAATWFLRRSPRLLPETTKSHEEAHISTAGSDCAAAGATVCELSVGRRRSPRASQALMLSFNSARIAGSHRTDPRATSRTAIILQPT